jgi:hypothetical protein
VEWVPAFDHLLPTFAALLCQICVRWIGARPVMQPAVPHPDQGTSAVSLIGGGTSCLRPGEISLAHGGVAEAHLTDLQVDGPKERPPLSQALSGEPFGVLRTNRLGGESQQTHLRIASRLLRVLPVRTRFPRRRLSPH